MALCAKVERKNAEKARQKLAQAGLLDADYVPARDCKFVYFALKRKPPARLGLKVARRALRKRSERGKPLRKALEGKLTKREAQELVASFDIVGDIAVVEIPPALAKKEGLIARAILKNHKNLRVVAKKTGGTAGEFRIRPVKVIAGEKRTFTVYREAGCLFELDLNKAYFSPRLGTERGRVAGLVKMGEQVLVPFAGVGPFAIRIAKKVPTAQVVGIELNPDAAGYFERNVIRNNCGNVEVLKGDVKELLPGRYAGWADRVAMPLPKDAKDYLPCVLPCLKRGGVLHYYSFGDSRRPYSHAEGELRKAAADCGRDVRVLFRRVVRPYSKDTVQVAIDAEIL
ncbi:MAG: class I SAM-dependent methyltransferase family protein [Candidatus Micrarchaeota archaeon]|nr:class I SAM-dependent methyltransferase family protein [Candidatus Micrarchaeota archaeon]